MENPDDSCPVPVNEGDVIVTSESSPALVGVGGSPLKGVLSLLSKEKMEVPTSLVAASDEGGASSAYSPYTTMTAEDYLSDKSVTILYFSAGWCPPCRKFSPLLSELAKKNSDVACIFVSHDRAEGDMRQFAKGKHFSLLPFRFKSFPVLTQVLSISMLPTVVIVSGEGRVITTWGRTAITSNRDGCVSEWKRGRSGVSLLGAMCNVS